MIERPRYTSKVRTCTRERYAEFEQELLTLTTEIDTFNQLIDDFESKIRLKKRRKEFVEEVLETFKHRSKIIVEQEQT